MDASQEMIALGLSNVFGSFASSMPVTGSFTRSAVNNASGVGTPFGGTITACLVLLALGFLTSTFYYIPKASLAAIIMVAMYFMVEFQIFIVLWKNKSKFRFLRLVCTINVITKVKVVNQYSVKKLITRVKKIFLENT